MGTWNKKSPPKIKILGSWKPGTFFLFYFFGIFPLNATFLPSPLLRVVDSYLPWILPLGPLEAWLAVKLPWHLKLAEWPMPLCSGLWEELFHTTALKKVEITVERPNSCFIDKEIIAVQVSEPQATLGHTPLPILWLHTQTSSQNFVDLLVVIYTGHRTKSLSWSFWKC